MISNFLILNVYAKKTKKSKIVTQLLYGDSFKQIRKYKSWIKIKNDSDNYIGYVRKRKFSSNYKNTHKVYVLCANLYSKPNAKSKIKKKLSFGSKIKVDNKSGNFYKFNNFWIKKNDLKTINFKDKNIFKKINKFTNVKYKWGGKCFNGIDCSGLIQLFFNFNNIFCPRDTTDQIKYFRKKIKLKNVRKNDLIFWKGHVALAVSKTKLIHGYGPLKKVVVMPIRKTIDRIYETANLKVTGIRRVT
ncbi:C40 family peptidase [bacterium]|nr:C40 family peptidase [bacterium]